MKVQPEPNAPDGIEVIATYYDAMDSYEGFDFEALQLAICEHCGKQIWISKKDSSKIKLCPFCLK